VIIPEDLKFSAEHEWVAVDGDRARVGITDYAQDALGDVVFVQLPEPGTTVSAAQSCGEVESTKSVSDVYSPVSGRVVETNPALTDTPELVNSAPYGDGWMFVVDMSDPAELGSLLDAAAYRRLTEES
jgi:glycine cleavage system H protein